MKKKLSPFSLVEFLVVIISFLILAATILVTINPGRKLAQARDTQRNNDLYSIANAVYQFASKHSGILPDTDGNDSTSNFPTTPTCIGIKNPCFNLGIASIGADKGIVPAYIPTIPMDPLSGTEANSQYTIYVDSNGQIIASGSGEVTKIITVTR